MIENTFIIKNIYNNININKHSKNKKRIIIESHYINFEIRLNIKLKNPNINTI